METKLPKPEKSDQIVWSLVADVSGIHGSKSYICSFCKRGFSNAQALGGHMNIHRKDRAKLKESSEENILSLDIVKTTNNILPPDNHDDHYWLSESILESSDEEKCSSPKRPRKLIPSASPRGKNDGFEELKRLPLFFGGSGGESLRLIHHGSSTMTSQIDLDLELRLGSDSPASSGSAK